MNNFINYFYNIKIDKINNYNNYYSFNYNNYTYKLYLLEEISNIDIIVNINKELIKNTLVSEIIYNKDNSPYTFYKNIYYILIRIYINYNKDINLQDIEELNNSQYKNNLDINWGILWEKKIDYLEDLINENGKKYPLLVDSFNYFVGLAENAISYYNNILIDKNYKFYISHKKIRIDSHIEDLYNPLNIIYDYKVRDIAEYIKISFYKNNKNIYKELNNYLYRNNLSITDIKLLISRILYPSIYFDLYDDILLNNNNENIINNIIRNIDEYEIYISNIISYFKKYYDIDEINWLKKNTNN